MFCEREGTPPEPRIPRLITRSYAFEADDAAVGLLPKSEIVAGFCARPYNCDPKRVNSL